MVTVEASGLLAVSRICKKKPSDLIILEATVTLTLFSNSEMSLAGCNSKRKFPSLDLTLINYGCSDIRKSMRVNSRTIVFGLREVVVVDDL